MKKIYELNISILCALNASIAFAAEKFEILPDLPEPLATAQAASVSTIDTLESGTQTIGHEPSALTVILSLLFVVLLIYATGIVYTKLNKMGIHAFKKQIGDTSSRVSVVSTTALGGNKTLHIVELNGKRMLLGASASSIQLLKDLGTFPPEEDDSKEYSKIEIPNIRIPKIEIPKIEIPKIGFTKAFAGLKAEIEAENKINNEETKDNSDDGFEISEIYEEGPDGIIDKLFKTPEQEEKETKKVENEHQVDPDEYALYKKYL